MFPAHRQRYRRPTTRCALVLALALTATPLVAEPPAAPSQLRGASLSDQRVRLRWQDNACDETSQHFQIWSAGRWREIPFSLRVDASEVILSGLQPVTEYTFRVVARNADGASPSEPASVVTFPAAPPCTVDGRRLCLLGGRFEVTARFESSHGAGAAHDAHAVPDGDQTGAFWFFEANNLELSVEITDGRAANGHFWVAAGGLSDLEYRLEVTDTVTGLQRVYVNPTRSLCGIDDRGAFAEGPPAALSLPRKARFDRRLPESIPDVDTSTVFRPNWRASAADCGADSHALSLHEGRFEVRMSWLDDGGELRSAEARYDSRDSGFFVIDRPELAEWALKILDGRSFNQHYWLFLAPLSGRQGWLSVTETVTGTTRLLHSPEGSTCGQAMISAFPVAPSLP